MQGLEGKIVVQPLIGDDRDEITALVARLKKASDRVGRAYHEPERAMPPADLKWAEDWQLPREVFDYFVLDHQAAEAAAPNES